MLKKCLFLIYALLTVPFIAEAIEIETLPPGPMITVKGVLLNPDRSIATNIQVSIFESKEKGSFTILIEPPKDGRARMLNTGTTDAKGRFTIAVKRAFLETRQAVLCVNRLDNQGIIPQYPDGKPFVIRAPKGTNFVDIGEVVIDR